MNVTDVHVNRAPLAGEVREVRHRPGGANRPAFDKESDRNEQVAIDFGEYELLVIAGWFARRIHPSVEPAMPSTAASVGHVSFGSRADVILPADIDETDLLVSEGDAVRAGETIIAERD